MKLILVVDDEPHVRQVAVRMLEDGGYQVLEATDGADALTMLEGGMHAVNLVVTDVVMPRVTGLQLLERLSVTHPGLPVIVMSGFSAVALSERGIAVPCAVLSKPFQAAQLLDEVRRCLLPTTSERSSS